jgi:AraC-like DNA-binding protein
LFYGWWANTGTGKKILSINDLAVHRMLEAIKRRPELTWSLAEMAAAGGMSPFVLRAACHEVLGKSPVQVKIQIKLSHAYEYLRRGDRNVAEVATALGFCDPYHFSKVFKNQFGCSPSEVSAHSR